MKRLISIVLLLVIVFSSTFVGQLAFADDNDTYVKIKLTSPIKYSNKVNLYSDSGFSIYDIEDLSDEITFLDVDHVCVVLEKSGIILLYDEDNNPLLYFGANNLITSGNGKEDKIKVEDRYYRDYITFNNYGDKLNVINYVTMEHYLYGTVSKEMGSSFEMEALKAQAIAIRTYALYNINKHKNEGYNLCDNTHCQAYGGMSAEYDKARKAVDETEGMIITYNGKPIDAVFHSSSGGHTDNAHEIWTGRVPYLVAVKDDFSIGYPNSSWQVSFSSDEISQKLSNSGYNVGYVTDIQILATTEGGRAKQIKIIGTKGESIITGDKLRSILGSSILKSTLFTIEKEVSYDEETDIYVIGRRDSSKVPVNLKDVYVIDDREIVSKAGDTVSVITENGVKQLNNNKTPSNIKFTFNGKGFGHGVGMSQYGAQGMAKAGYSYDEILKYYYTGVKIETID